jgi:hypothetical protein
MNYKKLNLLFSIFYSISAFCQFNDLNIIQSSKSGIELDYSKAAVISKDFQSNKVSILSSSLSQNLSFVGDIKNVLINSNSDIDSSLFNEVHSKGMIFINNVEFDSVLNNQTIVIINEAHDRIAPRAFIFQLLPKLKKMGFTHLAMETVTNNHNNILDVNTGLYTSEPVMGELYRRAINLGFKIISYEAQKDGSQKRDSIQAVNLLNNITSNGQIAKTVVICGYGHLYEWSDNLEYKMMGQYLYEISGLNPLTIDQLMFSECHSSKFNQTLYESIKRDSTITFNGNQASINFLPPFCDIYVCHPNTTFRKDRSNSSLLDNNKIWVDFKLVDQKEVVLAQVYLKDEIKNKQDLKKKVPCDQTTYFTNNIYSLALQLNVKYLLVLRNERNEVVFRKKIKL